MDTDSSRGGLRSLRWNGALPQATISPAYIVLGAVLAMLAFAANSLLCRAALKHTGIDPASFTGIRRASGVATLWLIVWVRRDDSRSRTAGSWLSALALFIYAAGFSFSYVKLPTAVGALVLFGSVQITMIGYGLWTGERLRSGQTAGLCLALGGLIGLLLPGLTAPPLDSALLMAGAGAAWGIYSLRGRSTIDPTATTAGNFLRAMPFALVLSINQLARASRYATGIEYAVASGTLASGVGYIIWYAVLPHLQATVAATMQLSVPVLATAGGVLFLNEAITTRLVLSSLAILGGIGLVVVNVHHPSVESIQHDRGK